MSNYEHLNKNLRDMAVEYSRVMSSRDKGLLFDTQDKIDKLESKIAELKLKLKAGSK